MLPRSFRQRSPHTASLSFKQDGSTVTASGGTIAFFVEASIGVRLLSHTRISPTRTLSTAFQFSDQLGLGVQWGRDARSTLGVRYQHISNAGIKKPNPGMDFVLLYYTHRF